MNQIKRALDLTPVLERRRRSAPVPGAAVLVSRPASPAQTLLRPGRAHSGSTFQRRLLLLRLVLQILAVSFVVGATAAETNSSQKHVDLTELPLEALMNLDIPKVYAASKLEQKTTEAPSSI